MRRFYPWLGALAWVVAACGGGDDTPGPSVAGTTAADAVFSVPEAFRRPYDPPADDTRLDRWLHHLSGGSREGLRFAKARLRELGSSAAPAVAARLDAVLDDPDRFGEAVNLLDVLAEIGGPDEVEVVSRVLTVHSVPVVRTQAYETAAAMGEPGLLPAVRDAVARETDPGPRRAGYRALSRLGEEGDLRFLEERVRDWLAAGFGEVSRDTDGQDAWNALIEREGADLLPVLRRLDPLLPPSLRVQALAARTELGDDADLAAELRAYLDPSRYPSARTRGLAVATLAELGDWDAVLQAADDPAPEVQRTVAAALARPEAAELGEARLEEWARSDDLELQAQALAALRARGREAVLDAWLRLAARYPLAEGSSRALQLLVRDALMDERLAPALIRAWPNCDEAHRPDLMRAMTATLDPRAGEFLGELVLGETLSEDDLRLASVLVANFPSSPPVLMELWRRRPDLAGEVLDGVARWAREGDEAARAFLLDLARGGRGADDRSRRLALERLPRVLGGDALPVLLEIRDREARPDVRTWLDAFLNRWF